MNRNSMEKLLREILSEGEIIGLKINHEKNESMKSNKEFKTL